MPDPTQRFSNRVENYVKYRPGYPPAILDLLTAKCGLTRTAVTADLGSGTGILTTLLLNNGGRVFGVEPNPEMRAAGERLLAGCPNFTSVAGTAEATTLPEHSLDLITAGQAFHWFDRGKARAEFLRILKPGGRVALLWNDRNISDRPFFQAYERLLITYGTDYTAVNHKTFDFAGLTGRLLSSSYAPEAGDPRHEPMLRALQSLFAAHQTNGTVTFDYDTTVYYGRLS
jgi:SAM-dependent methyltransferase